MGVKVGDAYKAKKSKSEIFILDIISLIPRCQRPNLRLFEVCGRYSERGNFFKNFLGQSIGIFFIIKTKIRNLDQKFHPYSS